ncbi:MAG TPA: transferrin receptor-like dimerization domain-containing protein, partial [Bryobacteraceae bacterium]|nr:transferrin receptor-like dimerization domain-containing protein [Bryobacteraceae bacterium]
PIRGFPSVDLKAQHELEDKAKAIPQPARIHVYMERMASKPHQAGSPGSKAVASYLAAQLQEWGLHVRTENFEALMPYPTVRVLEMTAPVQFRARLEETPIAGDPSTSEPGARPPFNAYSASGDVTAPLVYVNYGIPSDYDELEREGIDVKGKIVIARYGRSWRGVKVKLAQDNGALGCLLYSDPRDDGYFQDDAYPDGPMRPENGVQRGSVLDIGTYPGDPLSPGWASQPGSKRLSQAEAKSLFKIPVLPISYGDARPLLEQLEGPVAPEAWRGALPITYHIGPGPATVHLKVDFDWSTKPLYDVIATIPGSVFKNQWILYGNHHDAWVTGASDPASGASALMETARTLSILRQQGWQPKRTIVLALWDGEEFGLMGSTEWVEKHMSELRRSAAVYINSDSTGKGPFVASGSHSLQTFLSEVLRDIPDPRGSGSLLDAGTAGRRRGARGGVRLGPPLFLLGPLGSGSDYVGFVDHAGIASMNLGFGAGEAAGVYHSAYDTLAWFDRFSDGDLTYGKTLAQIMTTSILRLAGAPVLPFEFGSLSRAIRGYVREIQRDARKRSGTVDFRDVMAQLNRLDTAARVYDDRLAAYRGEARPLAPPRLRGVDESLEHAERTLLLPDGLPGRSWYEHQIYAPGVYTGYAAKTIPGVREAVEAGNWAEANRQARRVAQVLRALADHVDRSARLLQQAEK